MFSSIGLEMDFARRKTNTDEENIFKISFHESHDPPNLREPFVVKAGYINTIYVTPEIQKTNEAMKALSIERRKCRFKDETDGLKLFKQYTKNGCLLECHILAAAKECGCIPWKYPQVNVDSGYTRMCNYKENECFEVAMSNSYWKVN